MKKEESGLLTFTLLMSGIILVVIHLSRYYPTESVTTSSASYNGGLIIGSYINLAAGIISLFLGFLLYAKTRRGIKQKA
jgi:hypothetical protein